MRKATARISLVLVLALLLQLAAGPIGSLIPAASAASTEPVKKVLYSEDFSDYETTSVTIPSGEDAEPVAGWTQTVGSGTFTMADGQMNIRKDGSTGYHFAQLDVEGCEDWQNYTLEYDMVYKSDTFTSDGKANTTGNWFGMTYNTTAYEGHEKIGLNGTNGYFLNGRVGEGCTHGEDGGVWLHTKSGTPPHTTSDQFSLALDTTYRVKLVLSEQDGQTTGTAALYVATYTDGVLGEYKHIVTIYVVDTCYYKGTIGIITRNQATVSAAIDNIEVYQTEETAESETRMTRQVLYYEDFDEYTPATDGAEAVTATLSDTEVVDGWLQTEGAYRVFTLENGQMNVHKSSMTGYHTAQLVLEGSEEWSNYTLEYDFTYNDSTFANGTANTTSNWFGVTYNTISPDNHQKVGLSGTNSYFLNGRYGYTDSGSVLWLNDNKPNHAIVDGRVSWTLGTTYRVKLETSNMTGESLGTVKLSVAIYDSEGVLGDWIDILSVPISELQYKGSIGITTTSGSYTDVSIDNIEVYKMVETETVYAEDFSDYDKASVQLVLDETVDNWLMTGEDADVTLENGAMNIVGSASGYTYIALAGDAKYIAKDWTNYTIEADMTYNNLASYMGIVYNGVDIDTHQKAGVHGTAGGYFLNGRLDGKWVNDTTVDKTLYAVNNSKNPDVVKLSAGTKVRLKIETTAMTGVNPGLAALYIAYYNGDTLGDWQLVAAVDNIDANTNKGTIGFFIKGTESVTVDNIEVYAPKGTLKSFCETVLYEENFDAYDGDTAVTVTVGNTDASSGWKIEHESLSTTGSPTLTLDNGVMIIQGNGTYSYASLVKEGASEWSNYTAEADITYRSNPYYAGMVYNGTGPTVHQKAGICANGSKYVYFLNGRNGYNAAGTSYLWLNNDSATNNTASNLFPELAQDVTFRLKVETYNMTGTSTGSARLSVAFYDSEGKMGSWTEIADLSNISAVTYKGTIGFLLSGSVKLEVDNIKVYIPAQTGLDVATVSDIHLAETGITNPPVVVQYVTETLPDAEADLAAIAMVEIDKDLNILDAAGDVLCGVDQFLIDYKTDVIPAFIVDDMDEVNALCEFLNTYELIDVYVIARDNGTLTPELYAGSETVYTASSEGADLIAAAQKLNENIRGGLNLDADVLTSDLNNDGAVNNTDLAVICSMAANDTGVTQLIFDGGLTVDHMNYFNNHAVAAWGVATDAAGVYQAISSGYHAVVAEDPAIVYGVYESITATTVSGRPMPITHRGAHMNYGTETEVVVGDDGEEFTFYGETENSVEAAVAAWKYFGILGSEIDLCTTAVCSGDDATCSHTIIEGADACDHVNCELCQVNIILEHDKNLPNTTNFNEMAAKYPDIFNHGVAPQSYTLYELKMLTLTGKGNNVPTGTLKMATLEDVLAATEDLAGGNYVYYCHINHGSTESYFNKLMAEHPEYQDNAVIFVEVDDIDSYYSWKTLTAAVPITYGDCTLLTNTVNQPYMDAIEDMVVLFNRHNAHFLGYHYRMNTDGDDDFYYRAAARGIVSYHSITTSQKTLDSYHLTGEGAVGCLIEQPKLVDDWHYYVDAPTEMELATGGVLDMTHTVRTIVGDSVAAKNLSEQACGMTWLSGVELKWNDKLNGYTATEPGEAVVVFYSDRTADGGSTYRVYSNPVTVNVVAGAESVTLNKTEATVEIGQELALFATVAPLNAVDKYAQITWTTGDETIATVDADGIVTAITEGAVTITATTLNGQSASCVIQVVKPTAEAVNEAITAIDAIGTVTADSGDAIAAARAAYEALTAEQKKQVTNYETLLDAEEVYPEKVKEATNATKEQIPALEEAAEQAAAELKTAQDELAEAQSAKNAADQAYAEAVADANASEEAIAEAKAAAEQAAEDLSAAQADYDKAVEDKAAADKALADAKAEVEQANAAAALAEAKTQALIDINALADGLNDGLTSDQINALNKAKASAVAAITAAATAEELEKAVADGENAMALAVIRFEDVVPGAWYADSVNYMAANGYVSGISKTVFGVNNKLTRAQMVTILYRIAGEPSVEGLANPFTDVTDENAYYYKAVLWALHEDVVAGTSDTTFSPNRELTREQFAAMLYRWSDDKAPEADALAEFPDADKISAYAVDAMNWAVSNGLISGIAVGEEAYLTPRGTTTRAQAATILARYLADE